MSGSAKRSGFVPLLICLGITLAVAILVTVPEIAPCPDCGGTGRIERESEGMRLIERCEYCFLHHKVTLYDRWMYRQDPEYRKSRFESLMKRYREAAQDAE